MVRSFIVLLCSISSLNNLCMESQILPIIPVEVLQNFQTSKDQECTQYNLNINGHSEKCALPWTIAPTLLKSSVIGFPINANLANPKPNSDVLANSQLWMSSDPFKFRLSEDIQRTNDTFYLLPPLQKSCNVIYDGINKHNKAIAACICNYNGGNYYYICMFTQSNVFGNTSSVNDYGPILTEDGILRSLMLEDQRNRFICSVDEGNACYKIFIKDLIAVTQEHPHGSCNAIAEIITPELFTKTLCLEKDTYLGITESGNLYSLWLDDNNVIQCAEQKFSACSKKFKDISVDNTRCTTRGFKPHVAFLTKAGEIYITHLDAFMQPTLLYVTTINDPDNTKRLFYREGKLSIMYQDHKKVLVWQDNFELLYTCALLKKLYNDSYA